MLNVLQTRNVIPGTCEVLGEDEAPACAIAEEKAKIASSSSTSFPRVKGEGFLAPVGRNVCEGRCKAWGIPPPS